MLEHASHYGDDRSQNLGYETCLSVVPRKPVKKQLKLEQSKRPT